MLSRMGPLLPLGLVITLFCLIQACLNWQNLSITILRQEKSVIDPWLQCLEFSSFGWFPLFNKVSCLNFFCISSSKMYTNRYWVTKIARIRVFSFFKKITSGHRTLSRKASFWTIRTLSKDYGRIWYGDRKYFSPRLSITQLRELKIPRRFERGQRRLKMHSRLFIVYRDYSNSHSFPHHNWFTCSRHYNQIIKL